MIMSSKGILLLGGGRSGTSYLANLFRVNGVYTGPVTGNNCESVGMRHINDTYLSENFNAKKGSKRPYGTLPDTEIIISNEYKQHVANFVSQLKSQCDKDYWILKDPRSVLLHDMWTPHIDNIVGIYRNPVYVVKSYVKMMGEYFTPEEADLAEYIYIDYWKRFNQSLIHVLKNTNKPFNLFRFGPDMKYPIATLFSDLKLDLSSNNFNNTLAIETDIYDDPEIQYIMDELEKLKTNKKN